MFFRIIFISKCYNQGVEVLQMRQMKYLSNVPDKPLHYVYYSFVPFMYRDSCPARKIRPNNRKIFRKNRNLT
jgi:hypothetical protein